MIESITATIPVSGQSYTDLRPTISAESIEDYREQLAEVGKLAGNKAFVERMSGESLTQGNIKTIAVGDSKVKFDPENHRYFDEDGNQYLTGSTFASLFEAPFKAETIAPKVADKNLTTPDKVLECWDMKGEIAMSYGTVVHKALECGIKYGEMGIPNAPHLGTIVRDYLDTTHDDEQTSEVFVIDPEEKLCGTIDVLVNLGNKKVVIRDFKTGDLTKRITLTPKAKELFPDLKQQVISIYYLQLSFYAHILEKQGYKVVGLEIWYLDGDTLKVDKSVPKLNITEALKEVR